MIIIERLELSNNSAIECICFWVIWLKWKFLALACNGFQSRDVVITHSRYEAVEASLWPHPSIFISLLYSTGLYSHVRTEVLAAASLPPIQDGVDFLLLDFSYVVLYLYCCLLACITCKWRSSYWVGVGSLLKEWSSIYLFLLQIYSTTPYSTNWPNWQTKDQTK